MPPRKQPADTPLVASAAPSLSDDQCAALAHCGPAMLDAEVYAQVVAWQARMAKIVPEGQSAPHTVPGPAITG